MPYSLSEIIAFVREETRTKKNISESTTLQKDLGVTGDDHADLIIKYSQKYDVNISNYLWYFHTYEEVGFNPFSIIFKPPSYRVNQMDITMQMLLDAANAGKWLIEYPEHTIPKHRYDVYLYWALLAFLVISYIWSRLN